MILISQCPICNSYLRVSKNNHETLLVCGGKEGCAFIAYDPKGNLKNISFYQGKSLVTVDNTKLSIERIGIFPYVNKLNLSNIEQLINDIKMFLTFS